MGGIGVVGVVIQDHARFAVPSTVADGADNVEVDAMQEYEVGSLFAKQVIQAPKGTKPIQEVDAIGPAHDLDALGLAYGPRHAPIVLVRHVVEDRSDGRGHDCNLMAKLDVLSGYQVLLVEKVLVIEIAEHYDLHGELPA